MSSRYDEDVYDNPFYVELEKHHADLFEKATRNRWIVCIPQFACVGKEVLTREDFTDHILVPDEEAQDVYHTVSKHEVKIEQGVIQLCTGFQHLRKVTILFEETCYNDNDESYRVLCVAGFFNREATAESAEVSEENYKPPATSEECLKILWGNHPGGSSRTRDQLDRLLSGFCNEYEKFEGESLSSLVDQVSGQVTRAMQLILKDHHVRRSVKHSKTYMANLKIAVEVYMMNRTHQQLFATVTACVKSQDAEVNKMTRNLTEIRLHHLGVRQDFEQNLPLAKKEMAMLNKYPTPLWRLLCLKRVVSALTRPAHKSSVDNPGLMMTTDDFLPILIYLIIKSQIPNWTANLMYMKHFHQAKHPDDEEYRFYLATTEAALDYIRSGKLKEDREAHQKPQSPKPVDSDGGQTSGVKRQLSGGTSSREKFFQYVKFGDEAAVSLMLKRPKSSNDDVVAKMCHPLCSCPKCTELIAQSKLNSGTVSIFSRDDMGRTALHIASLYGQGNLIDILVKYKALVDATDFLGCSPLHLACQAGYQSVILLLVHFGADISVCDNEGNTPLHMCTANGHEDCVKAILFLDILKNRLNVNARNDMGDTPLHLAAKWGFEGIVKFLLETEADPRIRNRKKQTPLNLAQNTAICRQLQLAFDDPPPIIVKKQKKPTTLPDVLPVVTPPTTLPVADGFDVIDVVKPPKKPVVMVDNPELMSPTTPVVASLDQADARQKKRLFKAIANGDTPLVKFYLGWTNDSPEDDDFVYDGALDGTLCHPLCQCAKCQPIQKHSATSGLHVNCQDKKGFSPLHVAVIENRMELCRLFLKNGADPNVQTHKSITPLHLACYHANHKMVQLLIDYSADVNIADQYEEIALHLACAKGSVAIVKVLIQHDSLVNVGNSAGNFPLHHAAVKNSLIVCEMLLEAGADPTLVNHKQQTPLCLTTDEAVKNFLWEKMARQKTTRRSVSTNSIHTAPQRLKPPHQDTATPGRTSTNQEEGRLHDPGQGSHTDNTTGLQKFGSFDEKNLKLLREIGSDICSFDKQRSLRRSKTFDRSGSEFTWLKQSFSIQHFDTSTLKHVDPVDKGNPLYIYCLSYRDSIDPGEPGVDHSGIPLDKGVKSVIETNPVNSIPEQKGENSSLESGADNSSESRLKQRQDGELTNSPSAETATGTAGETGSVPNVVVASSVVEEGTEETKTAKSGAVETEQDAATLTSHAPETVQTPVATDCVSTVPSAADTDQQDNTMTESSVDQETLTPESESSASAGNQAESATPVSDVSCSPPDVPIITAVSEQKDVSPELEPVEIDPIDAGSSLTETLAVPSYTERTTTNASTITVRPPDKVTETAAGKDSRDTAATQSSSNATADPTRDDSHSPSDDPTGDDSHSPSNDPTGDDSHSPSDDPTGDDSHSPSDDPTGDDSHSPSADPTGDDSRSPSDDPTGDVPIITAVSEQVDVSPELEPAKMDSTDSTDASSSQTETLTVPSYTERTTTNASTITVRPPDKVTETAAGKDSRDTAATQSSSDATADPTGDDNHSPSADPTGHDSHSPSDDPTGGDSHFPGDDPTSDDIHSPSDVPTSDNSHSPSDDPTGDDPSSEKSQEAADSTAVTDTETNSH